MKKRTIELSLDKAREWYKQGGDLKEVALQAFKEEELCDVVVCKVGNYVHVKGNGEDFYIHDVPEFYASWENAIGIAKTFQFLLPTKSQLRLVWKHRGEINKCLNHPFCDNGYYWTKEQDSEDSAWYLYGITGTMQTYNKCGIYRIRAFATLPF